MAINSGGGYVAIILPQSILSGENYADLRTYIFNKFRVLSMLLTADITFKGTTTSPVMLFMRKEKMDNFDYNTMLIYSPKYKNPTLSKMKDSEINFLGYEFSENRNKTGIKIIKNSILEQIIEFNNKHLKNEMFKIPNKLKENIKIVKIKDIIINKSKNYFGDIYPKYVKCKGNAISNYCEINQRTEKDFKKLPTKYIEIGNLKEDKVNKIFKDKSTKRFCKKGDILVSSLNPVANNIRIADNDYMCSPAIYVLHNFKDEKTKKEIYKKLKTDVVLKQMNSMCDGFKITYAKISVQNFSKNVKI